MLRLRGGPGEAQTSVQNSNALFGACFSAISAPMMAYDMMM